VNKEIEWYQDGPDLAEEHLLFGQEEFAVLLEDRVVAPANDVFELSLDQGR
jgi:hypothetical protein